MTTRELILQMREALATAADRYSGIDPDMHLDDEDDNPRGDPSDEDDEDDEDGGGLREEYTAIIAAIEAADAFLAASHEDA